MGVRTVRTFVFLICLYNSHPIILHYFYFCIQVILLCCMFIWTISLCCIIVYYCFRSSFLLYYFIFSHPGHPILLYFLLFHIRAMPLCRFICFFISGSSLSVVLFIFLCPGHLFSFCISASFLFVLLLFCFHIRVIPFCCIFMLVYIRAIYLCCIIYVFLYPGHLSPLYYLYLYILIIRFFPFGFILK
jgi:hypothetical protein